MGRRSKPKLRGGNAAEAADFLGGYRDVETELRAALSEAQREIERDNEAIGAYRKERDWLEGKLSEAQRERDRLLAVLERDSFLDFVLDELAEAGGYQRGFTNPQNLARWDLKAAIRKGLDNSLQGEKDE